MTEATIDFVSGWIGGVAGVIGCHPFDTVKCRIQSQGSGNIPVRYKSGWHCFSVTIITEGVKGLYKGVIPPVVAQGAINAIVFGVEGPTNRFLQPRLRDEPSKEIKIGFLAGMVGGFAQSVVCAPVELVKLLTQHQAVGEAGVYRGNWETLMRIYHTSGIRGCYQGFWVTAFRDTPAFGTYFASYYGMMNYLARRKGISRGELSEKLIYPFVCGGLTGIITWTVNYPVDLVKTRIQLDGADGRPREYKSSWDCFAKAWREDWSTIDQQFAEEQRKKTEAELQQEEVRVCHRDNSSGDLPSPQQRMAHMHPLLTEGLEDVPTQSASGEGSEVFERIDAQKLAGALENAKTLGTMEKEGVPSHMLPLQQQQREQSTEPEKPPPPGKKARALFPFEGQREKELSFPKGAIIDLLHTVNENWLEGMVGQTKGIFPTSYVQVLSHEELREALAKESAPLMQARATYDFDPQNERELQFKKGDIIAITKKIDDNWFQGYLGDQKGIFPSSYVEILEATQ